MKMMVKIFLWLSLIAIDVQCQSLKGAKMVVTTVLETPYVMLRDSPQTNLTGNDPYEGYIVDLVDALSKMLQFDYVLKINEDGVYGSLNKTGRWTGMIGEVVDGRTHIAAGAMSITAERESAIDFTAPYMNLGIGILYKTESLALRGTVGQFFDLFYPFGFYSTDTFLLLTFVFGVILLILRRKYKTIVFRALLGFWLLFLFIFAALYIAQLTSQYVNNVLYDVKVATFTSAEELASQSVVTYGCIKGGSTEAFFRNSKSPIYKKMWSRMLESDPSPLVASSKEGIDRVLNGGYAFIAESTVIEYTVSRDCDLYPVGDLLDSKGFGLAVQKGSSLREPLSYAILSLQEQGVLSELKQKWWHERNGGGAC